jgi:EpsI family protein
LVATVSVVLLLTAALGALPRGSAVEPAIPLSRFPASLGDSWVRSTLVRSPVLGGDRADVALVRSYTGPSGRTVQLYVGYFGTQEQGREVINQQMLALEGDATRLRLTASDLAVPANALLQSAPSAASRYVIFWYDVNGRLVASGRVGKAWTAWEFVTRGRTNGAVVVITAEIPPGVQSSDVAGEAQAFARLVASELGQYLPR